MDRRRHRLGDMNWRRTRLNDMDRRRDVLLCGGRCSGWLLLDEERWLGDRLLAARFVQAWLLRPLLLLRSLFRTLFGFAIAVATAAMTIAPAAPVLFAFLLRMLACVGQPSFRAILMRLLLWLLWLLWFRRSLLLLPLAAGAGTVPLRAARVLARWPPIAATVAPAMTITITLGAAPTTVIAVTRSLV